MQVQSLFQTQTPYSGAMPATARIAADGKQDGRFVPPASARVDIGAGARGRLAAEQQASSDASAGDLPVGVRHMLERMVDDAGFGAKLAADYANNIHTPCTTLPEYMRIQDTLETGRQELQAAWQGILGQGKSPAQGYADLLRHELSMPQSYWDAVGAGGPAAGARGLTQAKLSYLEQYMTAQAG